MKDLAIHGPYPPPLGGISVHVKRIEPFLNQENISYTIYNHGFQQNVNVIATKKKMIWYLRLFFEPKYKTFHFHQFFYFHFIYYYLFSQIRNEQIVVTIHSERLFDYGNIKRIIALFFISKTKRLQLISVSKKLNDFLESKKIPSFHLPAYVPPSNVDCKEVEDSNELFLFSVWKLNRKLAEEIYNVPLAFEFLRKNKENLTMLFMVGNKLGSNLDYLEEIMSKYGVKDNLKVVFDENLVDYVHNCRFLLRPNKSDGYGVSLQEALDLGIPAIASDVCVRPKGTLLFENDNLKDMTNKINQVLNSQKENFLKEKEDLKYHTELIQLYKRLSSNETSNTEL